MRIYGSENNLALMNELGKRMRAIRIASGITQENMALRSGVSLNTVKRIENGQSIRLDSFFSMMRALNLTSALDHLIPEQDVPPTELLAHQGKQRKRASSRRKEEDWTWGDEL